MKLNEMSIYAISNVTASENDRRNLFALRCDLHALSFDQAKWVIVPKGGQMVIHFFRQSHDTMATVWACQILHGYSPSQTEMNGISEATLHRRFRVELRIRTFFTPQPF
jgi:hypothetical protein